MKQALPSAFRRIWCWPLTVGLITTLGLFAALLGDGAWDWVSAAALATPVAVAARFVWSACGSTPAGKDADVVES